MAVVPAQRSGGRQGVVALALALLPCLLGGGRAEAVCNGASPGFRVMSYNLALYDIDLAGLDPLGIGDPVLLAIANTVMQVDSEDIFGVDDNARLRAILDHIKTREDLDSDGSIDLDVLILQELYEEEQIEIARARLYQEGFTHQWWNVCHDDGGAFDFSDQQGECSGLAIFSRFPATNGFEERPWRWPDAASADSDIATGEGYSEIEGMPYPPGVYWNGSQASSVSGYEWADCIGVACFKDAGVVGAALRHGCAGNPYDLYVFNTHLTANTMFEHNTNEEERRQRARRRQLDMVRWVVEESISRKNRRNWPVLLGGDFNLNGHDPFRAGCYSTPPWTCPTDIAFMADGGQRTLVSEWEEAFGRLLPGAPTAGTGWLHEPLDYGNFYACTGVGQCDRDQGNDAFLIEAWGQENGGQDLADLEDLDPGQGSSDLHLLGAADGQPYERGQDVRLDYILHNDPDFADEDFRKEDELDTRGLCMQGMQRRYDYVGVVEGKETAYSDHIPRVADFNLHFHRCSPDSIYHGKPTRIAVEQAPELVDLPLDRPVKSYDGTWTDEHGCHARECQSALDAEGKPLRCSVDHDPGDPDLEGSCPAEAPSCYLTTAKSGTCMACTEDPECKTRIRYAGSVQWYQIDEAGPFQVLANGGPTGGDPPDPVLVQDFNEVIDVGFEVYQGRDLSTPVQGVTGMCNAEQTGGGPDHRPHTTAACTYYGVNPPYYIKVHASPPGPDNVTKHDRTNTGSYAIAFRRYTCRDKEDACPLARGVRLAYEWPDEQLEPDAGVDAEKDMAWFRVEHENEIGQMSKVAFDLEWQKPEHPDDTVPAGREFWVDVLDSTATWGTGSVVQNCSACEGGAWNYECGVYDDAWDCALPTAGLTPPSPWMDHARRAWLDHDAVLTAPPMWMDPDGLDGIFPDGLPHDEWRAAPDVYYYRVARASENDGWGEPLLVNVPFAMTVRFQSDMTYMIPQKLVCIEDQTEDIGPAEGTDNVHLSHLNGALFNYASSPTGDFRRVFFARMNEGDRVFNANTNLANPQYLFPKYSNNVRWKMWDLDVPMELVDHPTWNQHRDYDDQRGGEAEYGDHNFMGIMPLASPDDWSGVFWDNGKDPYPSIMPSLFPQRTHGWRLEYRESESDPDWAYEIRWSRGVRPASCDPRAALSQPCPMGLWQICHRLGRYCCTSDPNESSFDPTCK